MEVAVIIKLIDAIVIFATLYMRHAANAQKIEADVDKLLATRNKLIKGEITKSEAMAVVNEVQNKALGELDAALAALPVPTHESYTRGQN